MGKTAIEQLLANHGFELARQGKHRVYKSVDGRTFVTASTPSDRRAERNQLADLTRVLGTDKHSLLASLEKRRRRVRTPKPPPGVIEAAPAPSMVEQQLLNREDRQLAKRLNRIERNRAAKKARPIEHFHLFFDRLAVLFVDTDEIFFADHRGLPSRVIARRLKRQRQPSLECAARYQGLEKIETEELLTNPDLLCLVNCPHCGLTFVFRDGSIVQSTRKTALEVRDNFVANPSLKPNRRTD